MMKAKIRDSSVRIGHLLGMMKTKVKMADPACTDGMVRAQSTFRTCCALVEPGFFRVHHQSSVAGHDDGFLLNESAVALLVEDNHVLSQANQFLAAVGTDDNNAFFFLVRNWNRQIWHGFLLDYSGCCGTDS